MKNFATLVLATLAALALAKPLPAHHQKRGVVWVTEIDTVTATDIVYSTVWVDPTTAPTAVVTPSVSAAAPVEQTPVPVPEPQPQSQAQSMPVVAPTSIYTPPSAPSTPAVASTTSTPAPAPPSQAPPPPSAASSSPAAAPTSPTSGGSSPGKSLTGEITYYDVGLGSCGETSTANQPVVAVSKDLYDLYGSSNSDKLCGKQVQISYQGVTKTATIVDRCTGCAMGDLDLSRSLFTELAGSLERGRISGVEWQLM